MLKFKIKSLESTYKGDGRLIIFHGFELKVPLKTVAVAVDGDGSVMAYFKMPIYDCDFRSWILGTKKYQNVGNCQYKGDEGKSLFNLLDIINNVEAEPLKKSWFVKAGDNPKLIRACSIKQKEKLTFLHNMETQKSEVYKTDDIEFVQEIENA